LPQRHSQHALADAVDLTTKFAEAKCLLLEQGDHQQRPLVGDSIEDLANLAVFPGIPLERVVTAIGIRAVRR
jgi:hypothetical protein